MQTQTEILPRMKITEGADSPIEKDRAALARSAVQILGYKKMAQVLIIPDALAYTLRKLQIEPLVLSSVIAYKQKKERKGIWSCRWFGLGLIALTLITGSLAILGWNNLDRMMDNPHWYAGVGTFFGSIAFSVGTAVLGMVGFGELFCGKKSDRGTRTVHTWKRIPIESYSGSIPEFALRKAVQIKSAHPKAVISIDHLVVEREEDAVSRAEVLEMLRDPFLYVEYATEGFYIDVWDEKEYERSM